MPNKPDLSPYLGNRVRIVVDRPLGSSHPDDPDFIYRLNYGYIPDTVSGDGQPIDVYLLDVAAPVEEAEGVVIALIIREDDVEDKLVATVGVCRFAAEEISTQVHFQEQFFKSRVIALAARGA